MKQNVGDINSSNNITGININGERINVSNNEITRLEELVKKTNNIQPSLDLKYIYKYMSIKNLKLLLGNGSLHFSKVSNFNDPFEFCAHVKISNNINELATELSQNDLQLHKRKIKRTIRERGLIEFQKLSQEQLNETLSNTKVCCFSTKHNDILMWSHYADNHQGVCLKFDTTLSNLLNIAEKVQYSQDMPSYVYPTEFKKGLHSQLYTKAKDWEYENEVRILNPFSDENIKFEKESLVQIIFGCCTKDYVIGEIKKLAYNSGFQHIMFAQMKKLKTRYELKLQDI